MSWGYVQALKKGVVYKQGNIYDFHRFTDIEGKDVLYFGDHVYADLAVSIFRPLLCIKYNPSHLVLEESYYYDKQRFYIDITKIGNPPISTH